MFLKIVKLRAINSETTENQRQNYFQEDFTRTGSHLSDGYVKSQSKPYVSGQSANQCFLTIAFEKQLDSMAISSHQCEAYFTNLRCHINHLIDKSLLTHSEQFNHNIQKALERKSTKSLCRKHTLATVCRCTKQHGDRYTITDYSSLQKLKNHLKHIQMERSIWIHSPQLQVGICKAQLVT